MKKKVVIFIILGGLMLSLSVNIFQYQISSKQQQEITNLQAEVTEYEGLYTPIYEYFTALSVQDFEAKVASGERFTVYIGRPDCSDCNQFEPTFIELIGEKQLANKMYYLNVKWLRESDKDTWQKFKDTYGFTQTPAFVTFENGQQVSMIEWSDKGLPKSELEEWLAKQQLRS